MRQASFAPSFGLALFFVLTLGSGVSRAADWGPEVALTSTGGDIYGEGIAASGSTVHVIYGENEVRYRKSTDEGLTWTDDVQLDSGRLHLTDPIVADGNDVWAVELKDVQNKTDWCCSRDVGNIYLLHSGDAGATWDAPRKLTSGSGAFRVSLAYSAGRVHLVWMDYRDDAWDTYYLRSTDRGATWEPEKRIAISAGTFGAERPQIAASGDGVHVTIWDDRGTNPACTAGATTFTTCPDTFYVGSLDGGVTWGEEVNVGNSGAALAGRNDIAVAGTSSVVINFNRSEENTNDANPHLFAVHSPDAGATWDAPVQLTNTPGEADHGSIIGSGANVHLAWHDSRDGNLVIYYLGSSDEGVSWGAEERVSTPTDSDSSTPLVALTDGFVHVLWLDKRTGPFQVYYRRRAVDVVPPSTTTSTGSGAQTGSSIVGSGATSAASGTGSGGAKGTGGAGNGGDDGASSDGCGCTVAPHGSTTFAGALAAVAALLSMRRRRAR